MWRRDPLPRQASLDSNGASKKMYPQEEAGIGIVGRACRTVEIRTYLGRFRVVMNAMCIV